MVGNGCDMGNSGARPQEEGKSPGNEVGLLDLGNNFVCQ